MSQNSVGGTETTSRTQHFLRTREKRGAPVRMNPNDPEENPEAFKMMYGNDQDHVSIAQAPTHPIAAHYNDRIGGLTDRNSTAKANRPRNDKSYGSLSTSVVSTRPSRQRSGSCASDENNAVSVPKFGAWDEMEPKSGDGFTVVFNRAKEEKQAASATFRPLPHQTRDFTNSRKSQPRLPFRPKFLCCFYGGKCQ